MQKLGMRPMFRDLIGQHPRIPHRMQRQKRLRETSEESSLQLHDAVLSACHFTRIPVDKVKDDFFWTRFTNQRQHAPGITHQENNVTEILVRNTRSLGVFDILDYVGSACIFRQRIIVIVYDPFLNVEDNILEVRAETNGAEDVESLFLF